METVLSIPFLITVLNSYSTEYFTCEDGTMINMIMVNDFVTDCGPNAEDENILHIIHKRITNYKCDLKYQIPCREGHNKCYNVSEICAFKINKVKLLSPCRTAEHLKNCVLILNAI